MRDSAITYINGYVYKNTIYTENNNELLAKNKKKLIKKSEFYNAFNSANEYVEIFINATQPETSEVFKIHNSIRGIIDSSGTDYCWTGEVLHHQVPKDMNLDMNQFRFAYDGKNS